MGSFTSNLKLYKPAPTEFVDVESQLNSNWETVDKATRRLLEYEFSDESTPDIDNALARSRFYKSYSNSVTSFFPSQGFFYQDPGAFVSTWNKVGPNVVTPYSEHPDYPVAWRVIRKASSPVTTEIEWTGAFWLGGATLPLNTNVTGILFLPSVTIPNVSKYFNVNAGNTSANYSIARVGFFSGTPGTADLQYKRYGPSGSGTSVDENRIELTGLKYNIEVLA